MVWLSVQVKVRDSRMRGQRPEAAPQWGSEPSQELFPECLAPRIQQNPLATTPSAHLLTLPSRASSTETSRKKK